MKCYVTFVLQAVLMTSFCNWNTEWLHEMFYYYCNALLAGLPASSIKPLQLIQNAAARLIFNEPKRTHVTPLFINLHWLPIAAQCIKFKALMFAYKTILWLCTVYLNSLLQTYMPSRSLCSASERRITVPSQRATKSLSQTFTLTVPIWWPAQLNPSSRVLTIFKKRLKHISSIFIWLSNSSTLYSNSIWSNLYSFYLKKHKHLTLYQLHIYSLTASFSCKTNTVSFFLYFTYSCFKEKRKKTFLRVLR